MPKTADAQAVRTIAAKAACGEDSVRNFYAGRRMRSVTEFRIRNAINELGPSVPRPESMAVSSVPGSKS